MNFISLFPNQNLYKYFINLIFQVILSKKNQATSLSINGRWGEGGYYKIRSGVSENHQDNFQPCQVLIYSPPPTEHKKHLLCLIRTKIAPIRPIGSVWRRIRYVWTGINLGQNSVTPQSGGGDEEWSKTKNLHFFKLIDGKSNVV